MPSQPSSPTFAPNKYAQDAVLAVPFSNRASRDYAGTGASPAYAGFPAWVSSPRGYVLQHTTNSDRTNYGVLSNLSLTACTVVIGLRKRDATLRATSTLGVPSGGLSAAWGLLCPYSDGKVYWDWGGTVEGATRLSAAGLTFGDDVWAFTTGPRGMEIWQNGIRRAANTATPSRSANTGAFGLANYTGGSDLVDHSSLMIYRRQLPAGWIRDLSDDPWAAFRTRSKVEEWALTYPTDSGPPPSFVPAWAAGRTNTLIGGW